MRYSYQNEKFYENGPIEPLFRPYIFVKVSNKEYFDVLQIPSVLNFICFGGQAAIIPDNQIALIRSVVDEKFIYQVIDEELTPSQKARITAGPLKGYNGEIVCFKGKKHLQLKIENLNYSLIVEIENSYLSLCN